MRLSKAALRRVVIAGQEPSSANTDQDLFPRDAPKAELALQGPWGGRDPHCRHACSQPDRLLYRRTCPRRAPCTRLGTDTCNKYPAKQDSTSLGCASIPQVPAWEQAAAMVTTGVTENPEAPSQGAAAGREKTKNISQSLWHTALGKATAQGNHHPSLVDLKGDCQKSRPPPRGIWGAKRKLSPASRLQGRLANTACLCAGTAHKQHSCFTHSLLINHSPA